MAKRGRPSAFSEEIADEICERLAMDESLASICNDEHMPTTTSVYRWRSDNEKFRADYARAREEQGHTVADTIGEIRKMILSGDVDPNQGKAAADLAKWEASRRASREFGDRLDLTSGNEPIAQADDTAIAVRAAALVQAALARDESE